MQRSTDFWPAKSPSVTMNSTRAPGIAAGEFWKPLVTSAQEMKAALQQKAQAQQAITRWPPNGPKLEKILRDAKARGYRRGDGATLMCAVFGAMLL
jgi:hypothetical protein